MNRIREWCARPPLAMCLVACAVVIYPLTGDCQTIPTEIAADTLEYQKTTGRYLLKGNVTIRRDAVLVTSDEAEYDERTSRAVFRGNVAFEDGAVEIDADSAEINLNDKTGTINGATLLIRQDNYHITAERIDKIGDDRYTLKGVSFTTCEGVPRAWCFTASDADVAVGDRMKAGNVVLRIRDVPVLYTPYLWAPILTERKTGLLFPRFGFDSELGVFYRQPFFLVLADNRDTTLTLDYYSEKGLGEGIEYRYVERGGIRGTWDGYHVRDNELERDFFEFNALHEQRGAQGFSHFLNLHAVTERDFYRLYRTGIEDRSQRFLESTASVSYATTPARLYVSGQYWYDLRADDDTILQRLPEAGVVLHPVGAGPFLFSFKGQAINFHSEESYRVQRYSATPGIRHGIGNAVRLDQALEVTGAWYEINHTDAYSESTDRTMLFYSAGLNTTLFRKYGGVTHTVEPEMRYIYTTDTEYDAPVLDSRELTGERSDIIVALENRLFGAAGAFFSFRMAQPYDLQRTYHPLKPFEAGLALGDTLSLRFGASYDHYDKQLETLNGEAGLRKGAFRLAAGQRYDRENDIRFYTGRLAFPLTRSMILDNGIWYDAGGEGLREFSSALTYTAQCWGITLTYTQKPDNEYSVLFAFQLKGLGDFRVGAL